MVTHGEFDLIAEFFAPLSQGEPGAYGLTDDAAVLGVAEGRELVVSTDTVIEGVHFPSQTDPTTIAARAVAVSLSDLAAMGAEPRCYFLSLSLPKATPPPADWLAAFAVGLKQIQDRYGVSLGGGDTVATPGPLSLTVTVLGTVLSGQALRRAGARAGDKLCVSGWIGDAALGLRCRQGGLSGLGRDHRAYLTDRFDSPTPRLALGQGLAGLAHAAQDISDGLVQDTGHLCRASGVRAIIYADKLPLSAAATAAIKAEQGLLGSCVLGGGDDYELVFAIPPDRLDSVLSIGEKTATPVTVIGDIEAGDPVVTVVDSKGTSIQPPRAGYRHF